MELSFQRLSTRQIGEFSDLIKSNFIDDNILNCPFDVYLGFFHLEAMLNPQ